MGVYSIPVTLGINEEAIEKKISEDIQNRVYNAIGAEVREKFFDQGRYGGPSRVEEMVVEKINELVNEYKDTIILLAVDKLADKLSRQKAVRERAGEIAKEIFGDGN